ncbi:hypothetical protein RHMOL_Rhmol09G0121800 [Rhododendron molle]|uniref:Uncharacterized protein n=1 Tax=Rhododendron molle TaxID=49168 RepID=A0ACC0MCI6_RHOML|nr:hypothetical protein RHMOL_Rhmol09G0121800 [Rhododendron molle]
MKLIIEEIGNRHRDVTALRPPVLTTAFLDAINRLRRVLLLEHGVPGVLDRVVRRAVEKPGDCGSLVAEPGVRLDDQLVLLRRERQSSTSGDSWLHHRSRHDFLDRPGIDLLISDQFLAPCRCTSFCNNPFPSRLHGPLIRSTSLCVDARGLVIV